MSEPKWINVDFIGQGRIFTKDGQEVQTISPGAKIELGDMVLIYKGKILKTRKPKRRRLNPNITAEVNPIIIVHVGETTSELIKKIYDWTGKEINSAGWTLVDDGKYITVETGNLHDDPDDYFYYYYGNGLNIPVCGSGTASKKQVQTKANYILNEAIEHEVFIHWDYMVGAVPVQYMAMRDSLVYFPFKIESVIPDYNCYVEDGVIYLCNAISGFVNGVAVTDGIITDNFYDFLFYIKLLQKRELDGSKISLTLQSEEAYKPTIVGFNLTTITPGKNKLVLLRSTLRDWGGSNMSDKIQEEIYDFENPGVVTIGKEYSRGANRLSVMSCDGNEVGDYDNPVKHFFSGGSTITKHTETDGSEWYDVVFNLTSKYAYNSFCNKTWYSWYERPYSLVVNNVLYSITPVFNNPLIMTEQALYDWFVYAINLRDITTASIMPATEDPPVPMKLKIQAKPENAYWQTIQASTTPCTIADTVHKIAGTIDKVNIELKMEKNRDFTTYRQSLWCGGLLVEDTYWRNMLLPWSEQTITEDGKWLSKEWGSAQRDNFPPIYLMDKNISILHVHVDSKFKCVVYSKTEYVEQLDGDNKQIWTYELLPYRFRRWLTYVGDVLSDFCYLKLGRYKQDYGQIRRTQFNSITRYYIWTNGQTMELPWNRNNREYYLTGSPIECLTEYPTVWDSENIDWLNPTPQCWFDIGYDKDGIDLEEDNRHCSRIFTSATKNRLLVSLDSYKIKFRHILERQPWYNNVYTLLPKYVGADYPPFIDSKDADNKDRFVERKWVWFGTDGKPINYIVPPDSKRVNGLVILHPDDTY